MPFAVASGPVNSALDTLRVKRAAKFRMAKLRKADATLNGTFEGAV
jgi:hypothetical protein